MTTKPIITYAQLNELFDINILEGTLRWKEQNMNNSRAMGKNAGYLSNTGYLVVHTEGRLYKVHRLIWLAAYGKFPDGHLDHADNDKLNNKISNLRQATDAMNAQNKNKRRDNTSGHTGVLRANDCKRETWIALLMVDRKRYTKRCPTFEQAVEAYKEFKRLYHTFSPWTRG